MPTHKGIKLSVLSQWELMSEFPHPDTSQFTYRSPNLKKYGYAMESAQPSASSYSKADRLLGRQSSVSVYIPSLSGSRFWIRYSIMGEPATTWYYFKLFMNGRHITSWGINARKCPSGEVMRGLFDPSERWNYKDNGIVYKNNGTEARPFFFNREVGACSAANDGGLIEVLVFRATGRRRRLARPEEFKKQEQYGILMPSGGLLDRPEDAKFFDWHLKDPKDNPFATFRFHYRSWDHLVSLQLIPADHSRTLLPATRSLLSLNGEERTIKLQMEGADHQDARNEVEDSDSGGEPRDSLSSDNSTTPWLTAVFDDSPVRENIQDRGASTVPHGGSLLYPDQCKIGASLSKFSDAPLNVLTCMQPGFWANTKNRPLPEIPICGKLANHSRNSSTVSHAPSIAASLLPYLERESNTSPEPVIGVAAIVPIVRAGFCDEYSEDGQSFDLSSKLRGVGAAPANITVPWTAASKRQGMASPPLEGIFNLPKIFIRHKLRQSEKSEASPEGKDSMVRTDDGYDDHENRTTVSLTESEWMCRTPSPTKAGPDRFSDENLSSTGFESNRPSEGRSSLRKKAMDWYDEIRGHEVPDQTPTRSRFRHGLRIRAGNWI